VAGYDADGYLVNPDGSYDHDYAGWLADGGTRARDGVLMVAVDGDDLLGTVTWCPPGSPFREVSTRADQAEFRTLSVALAGGLGDEVLSGLTLRAVLPAPDASRLLVCLEFSPGPQSADARLDLADVLSRLERARPMLRREVAHSLTRKRAPELEFAVVPRQEAAR